MIVGPFIPKFLEIEVMAGRGLRKRITGGIKILTSLFLSGEKDKSLVVGLRDPRPQNIKETVKVGMKFWPQTPGDQSL